jgi:hypothetical protein
MGCKGLGFGEEKWPCWRLRGGQGRMGCEGD